MYLRKAVVAIADGVGDLPNPELGGLTPLQAAHAPNLDALARQGSTGIMDLVSPGIPVGTDLGHLILFGGNAEDYPGRGPVEAAGICMPVEDGDVLFRCNFGTVDETGRVADRRAGRISERTQELAASLDGLPLGNGIIARFRAATEHRAVLILRGQNLGGGVSDTDPKHENNPPLRATATDKTQGSANAAAMLNAFLEKSRKILKEHPVNKEREKKGGLPANCILTRGAGQYKALPSIPESINFSGCCVAAEATVLGMARLMGYSVVTHPEFTANSATNALLKAHTALHALETNDLVFVHFKATDLAGHDNSPIGKVAAIEAFDRMVGEILRRLPPETYIALAADHSTPCVVREHSGDPVPVVICGGATRTDNITEYNEISCAHGGLGRITGNGFINTIFDCMGRSKKRGS